MGLACDTVEVVEVVGFVFIFCLGMATLKSLVFFVGMVTLLSSPVCVFFSFCLLGLGLGGGGGVGEAGDSPQPQFSVEDMWRVFVECVLLMAGLQPHLA